MKYQFSRALGVLFISLVMISLTLFVLELLVRIAMPQQLIMVRSDIWMPIDHFGYHKYPNLDTKIHLGERPVRLMTNDSGYRIGLIDHREPVFRILALGDSFLEALQVEYEQTMTSLLDKALSEELGERVETVNTGVGGYNPNHYLLRARYELAHKKYDLVMVYIYLGNDIIESRQESFKPRSPTLRHKIRIPKGFQRNEIINAWLYPINDFLEERSHLYILFKDRARVLLARIGLTAYYFPEAVLRSFTDAPRWTVTANVLKDLALEAKEHDTPCIFVLLPANYQVIESFLDNYVASFSINRGDIDLEQPARMLTRELENKSFIVLNTTEALRDAYKKGRKDLYGRIDTHFSPTGHEIVASYLKPYIVEQIMASRDER